MKFERGQNVKEALRIGRKANATVVSGYYMLGKVKYDDGWISANSGFSTTDKAGTRHILKCIELGKKPTEYFIKKLFLDHFRKKDQDHPLTIDENFDITKRIRILEFYMNVRGPYSPIVGNIYGHHFNLLEGKDLVFENVLYVIPDEIRER